MLVTFLHDLSSKHKILIELDTILNSSSIFTFIFFHILFQLKVTLARYALVGQQDVSITAISNRYMYTNILKFFSL